MHWCSMFLGIKNCGFSKLWVLKIYGYLKLWVLKTVGTKLMAPKKICVGIQNFKFACTKICGYLKFVGTCSKTLNFVGT